MNHSLNAPKKVFVSGCFDMLHSGHIAFFQQAARYGNLHVSVASDTTIYELKGRVPVNSQEERLYMVQSVGCVNDAFIASGTGMLDFLSELKSLRPDIFVVNADGSTPSKEALCQELGIEYVVLSRTPHAELPPRSTTSLRMMNQMPYRVDLAGAWLDQPFVSKLYPGAVLTASILPTIAFNERSGMATSTRNHAIDLWGPRLPVGEPEKLAKILFAYDNPPGTQAISGSQDAIGIVLPGLNRSYYTGQYWPEYIESIQDEDTLRFVEQSLYLVSLGQREFDYDPLINAQLTVENAKALSIATDATWDAIANRDLKKMGQAVREAFEAQINLLPNMINPTIQQLIDRYADQALGWKLTGAGGGGYLVFVSESPLKNSVQLSIRRAME
jgi:cytidyltransferase-like protein